MVVRVTTVTSADHTGVLFVSGLNKLPERLSEEAVRANQPDPEGPGFFFSINRNSFPLFQAFEPPVICSQTPAIDFAKPGKDRHFFLSGGDWRCQILSSLKFTSSATPRNLQVPTTDRDDSRSVLIAAKWIIPVCNE